MEQRNQPLEHWNAIYQGVADTVTGLFELVQRTDLANRVRPTTRRRAGLPEETDEQAPEEGEQKPEGGAPAGGGS